MDLILQKDVKNLGKVGDRVEVKVGFARNYLLPNRLALVFDERKAKEWKHKQYVIEKQKKRASQARKEVLKKISGANLVFERESKADGVLFGSISCFDISKQLEEKYNLLVDKKDIKTPSLREVGDHKVLIELDSESKTEILVEIKRKLTEDKKKLEKVKSFFSRFKKESPSEEKPKTTSLTEESYSKEDSGKE